MESWKENTLIGPNFTVGRWETIRKKLDVKTHDGNWEEAIAAIAGRFEERLIKPANSIQDLDKTDKSAYAQGRGFAIVALDCLLLESLYGYEAGDHTEAGATTGAFEKMLRRDEFGVAFRSEGRATSFVRGVRNSVLHDGETREGWIVWQRRDPGHLVELRSDKRLALDRDAFHDAVKACLRTYFAQLRATDNGRSLRLRMAFIKRVELLCAESDPSYVKPRRKKSP